MPAEELDLEVAVEGFSQFMSQMGRMDGAIGQTEKRWGGLSGVAAGVTRSLQTVGTIGLAAIAGGAAVVGGLTVAIGKMALEAAPIEALGLAFAGLTEGMGVGAEEMLSALREGSVGMIAQRDLMASFNKAAALVGDDFAQMLPDAMGYMGKVAAATGQSFGFMLDSLVTGVGRLSPMILDNLAIQVSLSEATERAAEMFGVEASELTKAQQQAGMMNVVMEKLAVSTANMPEVAGTAAAGIAGMKAQFQDTKDAIGMAFLPVLNTLLKTFADMASRHLPIVMAAVEQFAEKLSGLIEFVVTAVEEGKPLSEWLDLLPGSIRPIVDGVLSLIETVKPFIDTVADWISENVKLEDILIALGIAIGTVVIPIIITLISVIAPVIAVFAGVILAIAALRSAWETDFLGIKTIVEAVIGFVTTFIGNALETIQAWWNEHGAAVMTIVDAFMGNVKAAIEFWIGVVSAVVETVLGAIMAFWDVHGASIMLIVTTVWENIKTVIETVITTVQGIIQAVALAIEGDWEGFGEKLREVWENLWDAVEEILRRNVETIMAVIRNLIDSIKRFFTDTDWGEVARSIIDGIVSGLRNGIAAVSDAARAVAQAALDAAKGFLGIDSPSSIFIEVGKNIGEGLIAGINSMASGVQESATELVEGAIGIINTMLATGQALGGIGGGFAARFRQVELDPMEEQIKLVNEQIEALERLAEAGELDVPGYYQLFGLERQRTDMLREQARLQEVLLGLEKQRQDLAFLEQQMRLLDLIQEHGLDAQQILGGMELGIDASAESLVRAMTAAMQQIIAGIETELEISSPSQRFAEIGSQMMSGLGQGIAAQVPNIQAQIQTAVLPASATTSSSDYYDQRQYHYGLTTQSLIQPGGLAMEFTALEMASR